MKKVGRTLLLEMQNSVVAIENNMGFLNKLKLEPPSNLTSDYTSKRTEVKIIKEYSHSLV